MRKVFTFLFLTAALTLRAQNEVIVRDADLQGGQTYTWTSDKVYLLDGFVYLEEGGVLHIEPGTVIKGLEVPSSNDLASALIITRGAKIYAEGTAQQPIIFTAELDDVTDPADLDPTDRGLWGGLIILGKGIIADETTEEGVEGLPADELRARYGGNDDHDNSGVLRYVSIRHGGAELSPGNEINGLTLGAVGDGTVIEYVEVIANQDDGIELFGGTVNLKYAAVSFCGDDSFDYDTGWRGKGQFWLSLQGWDESDNAGEHDGAKPDDNEPTSNPLIYNATYIGSGIGAPAKNEHALLMRDGTAGTYANSIFTDFANYALQVEDRASGLDSYQRLEMGQLKLRNNLWWNFGEGTEANCGDNGIFTATDDANDPNCQALVDSFQVWNNLITDPVLQGISRTTDGGFDPRADVNGPAYDSPAADYPADPFYTPVLFKGAFCSEGVWIQGWTALAQYGVLDAGIPFNDTQACEAVTGTDELFAEFRGFVLAQNTPNPVADHTDFHFTLPTRATVSLKLYDAQGRQVADILPATRLGAGAHRIGFDASRLPAGNYFFTLEADGIRLSRKMAKF